MRIYFPRMATSPEATLTLSESQSMAHWIPEAGPSSHRQAELRAAAVQTKPPRRWVALLRLMELKL